MQKLFLICCLFFTTFGLAQEEYWFFIRAKDTAYVPEMRKVDRKMIYEGDDKQLHRVFSEHNIHEFKKTFKRLKREDLRKTFFVVAESPEFLDDLLRYVSHLFEFGEMIAEEDKKIFEPNDYGITSTIGKNESLPLNLDYMDFLEVPRAWYYTTGSRETIVGISDAIVDTLNPEFKGKTTVLRGSSTSNGHGSGVAGIAAAQGNNGYGAAGICYDCSIYATSYGDFKKFDQLLELSELGVKVINCSWAAYTYYETAQAAIDEMWANGTIIVGAAGNKSYKQWKDNKLLYPASYDKVISVSSVMYKHPTVEDNTKISETGDYFASNIRGYLGRSIGFKDNDPEKRHRIYQSSTATLNTGVDILAPSAGQFRYSVFVTKGEVEYIPFSATSPAAPLVTGTIALMQTLNPCLPVEEVEPILKITSMNIDHIYANEPFKGKYGAGALNTGRAVEMVYQLYTPSETTYIQNQRFSRWDFKLRALSKEVIITDQEFTEGSTLDLQARNRIVIGENTILRPNESGSVVLKINPSLEQECELQLRDGFPGND